MSRHLREDRMIVRLPADITPAYFSAHTLGVHIPVVQAGLEDNDWLVVGQREGLIHFANLVAQLTG